jgi:hypothetical protein
MTHPYTLLCTSTQRSLSATLRHPMHECREADLVILTCVRAPMQGVLGHSGVGFLSDKKRMNVALTRARKSLWVVGHAETLSKNRFWARLVEHAADQDVLFRIETPLEAPSVSSKQPIEALVSPFQHDCDHPPFASQPPAMHAVANYHRCGFTASRHCHDHSLDFCPRACAVLCVLCIVCFVL